MLGAFVARQAAARLDGFHQGSGGGNDIECRRYPRAPCCISQISLSCDQYWHIDEPVHSSVCVAGGTVDRISVTAHEIGAILSLHLASAPDLVTGRTSTQAAQVLRLGKSRGFALAAG